MSDSTDDPGPARRETSPSVVHARAAKALVGPVHEKLGAWQAETIKLHTRAQRLKATGGTDPALAKATRTLLGFTTAQSAALELQASEVPHEIGKHTRVVDTLRVLAMLTERLEQTLGELGEASDKGR